MTEESPHFQGNRFKTREECPPEGRYIGKLVASVPRDGVVILLFSFSHDGKEYRAGLPVPSDRGWFSPRFQSVVRALGITPQIGQPVPTSELLGRPLAFQTENRYCDRLKKYYIVAVRWWCIL